MDGASCSVRVRCHLRPTGCLSAHLEVFAERWSYFKFPGSILALKFSTSSQQNLSHHLTAVPQEGTTPRCRGP